MKNIKSWIRNAIVTSSVLGMAAVSAHGHDWDRGHDRDRDHDRYDRGSYYVRVAPQPEFAYARVIDVDPIVRRVAYSQPQQDCWYEEREVYPRRGLDQDTTTPTIVGAIIGGVVGHQFGSGHARNVGTVAGVVLGASVGHDVAVRSGGSEVRSVQRCGVRDYPQYEERIDGYRVTYLHCGRRYTTVMPYDPGERVRVRVGANVVVVQ